jgi:hypothetical protein
VTAEPHYRVVTLLVQRVGLDVVEAIGVRSLIYEPGLLPAYLGGQQSLLLGTVPRLLDEGS